MKTIIAKKLIGHQPELGGGVFSFMIYKDKLKEIVDLDKMYQRKGLALKVFKDDFVPFDKFRWGYIEDDPRTKNKRLGALLKDATIIQNLFAIEGIAPRIYDIVIIHDPRRSFYAQVVDWVDGKVGRKAENFVDIKAKYRINFTTDPNFKNWIGGKLLDFQNFWLADKKEYKKKLAEMANSMTDWGSKSGISYESVEELGVIGQRDTEHRTIVLGLDQYDFKGKTVLDIGCSTGSFCRMAARKGAARTVGIDIGETAVAAREISNYLGDWNIDYYDYHFGKNELEDYKNIKEMTGLENFDIVFFLSVNAQVGYPTNYIGKLCNEAIFVEGHSGEHEQTYRPMLEKNFKVTFKGRMRNNARPALIGLK